MRGILKLAALVTAAAMLVPGVTLAQGGTIRGRVADTTTLAVSRAPFVSVTITDRVHCPAR